MHDRPATRNEALRILRDFAPATGGRYAAGRNFDHGPGRHTDVSTLSPYLRRRLVTEREVVAAAIDANGPEVAEKFVQEVLWRGYFKGWLERRPSVWDAYRDGLADDLAALSGDDRRAARVAEAEGGRTGIACFDAWVEELVTTGYLHNHARMWFASIWIFTLRLPWRIGADFFYRHLLDGDPASNTLSWRWVAGLHTRGKAYEARPRNIAKFTDRRFQPESGEITSDVVPLSETEELDGLPPTTPVREVRPPDAAAPTALLVTEEDLCPQDFDRSSLDIRGTATVAGSDLRSPRPVAAHVRDFERRGLADAASRLGGEVQDLGQASAERLADWADGLGARQIVTPYIPRGPLFDLIEAARPALDARGIPVTEWRRDWDALIWPHATAGFFKVKKKIPHILHESGLS